jgi:hypothetical protein
MIVQHDVNIFKIYVTVTIPYVQPDKMNNTHFSLVTVLSNTQA